MRTEEEEVLFSCQIKKSIFGDLVKKQAAYTMSNSSMSVLKGILFELENNILTMVSSDAARMLETKVKVSQPFKNGAAVYDGRYLGMLRFMPNICMPYSFPDVLQLNFCNEYLEIKDLANGIVYEVPRLVGQFPPNWESLFPTIDDNSYTTIGVNVNFINELKNLSSKSGRIELTIKNNAPLNVILAKSDNVNIQSRVLIMPIQYADRGQK